MAGARASATRLYSCGCCWDMCESDSRTWWAVTCRQNELVTKNCRRHQTPWFPGGTRLSGYRIVRLNPPSKLPPRSRCTEFRWIPRPRVGRENLCRHLGSGLFVPVNCGNWMVSPLHDQLPRSACCSRFYAAEGFGMKVPLRLSKKKNDTDSTGSGIVASLLLSST